MSTMLLVQLGLTVGLGAWLSAVVWKRQQRMRPQRIDRSRQLVRRR